MAITQDTFNQYVDIGYHGQLNRDFHWWAASPKAEGGSIGFGVVVEYGTEDDQAVVLTSGVPQGKIIGVTLRTQSVENTITGLSEYEEGRAMSVLVHGRMYVRCDDATTAGDPVYGVPATGAISGTAEGNIELNGRFVRTAAAGEITEIELY